MKSYQSHKKHGTNYSFLTLQREQKELEKFKKLEYEKAMKVTFYFCSRHYLFGRKVWNTLTRTLSLQLFDTVAFLLCVYRLI